jgi:Uma2 family endonuclease
VADEDLGAVFVDRARVSHLGARLSVEPDVTVVLWASLAAGRVKEIAAASGKPGRYVELEGAPDLVVEIISDSSARKDRERLPRLYAAAGVPELWLVDAREDALRFEIFALEESGYRAAEPDAEGWLRSPLLARRFRLLRRPAGGHRWGYRLDSRPLTT